MEETGLGLNFSQRKRENSLFPCFSLRSILPLIPPASFSLQYNVLATLGSPTHPAVPHLLLFSFPHPVDVVASSFLPRGQCSFSPLF